VARELIKLGHCVTVYEPEDGWSRVNALADGGASALPDAAALAPGLEVETYTAGMLDLDRATDRADVVLVHEWNTPDLVAALGRQRRDGAPYTLLFHDTHHRAVTAADDMARYELDSYDGVLAFGDVLRDIYQRRGWTRNAFTWHEAADIALFHPRLADKTHDLIWIGNWGDDERTAELEEFLIQPVAELGLHARVHGVRYPQKAIDDLAAASIDYAGWLPNHQAPRTFAQARLTVHVPRGPYAKALPGIPTIRVFEALACGIPLISAPWSDAEGLFPDGAYLKVKDGSQMKKAMQFMLNEHDARDAMIQTGLAAIRERHTCAHRVRELLAIVAALTTSGVAQHRATPQNGVGAP
jgi:spore maturation protein CgeB